MKEKNALFKSMGFTCTDTKSRHMEFLLITDFECWEINLIFQKPLVCHCVKYDSVFNSFGMREK